MDGVSGELLFSSEPNALCQIASLTKLMTMFVVLKQALSNPGLLHEWVLVSPEAASVGGTSADIRAGELYRVKDLLYGLMLPSGNDAGAFRSLSDLLGLETARGGLSSHRSDVASCASERSRRGRLPRLGPTGGAAVHFVLPMLGEHWLQLP